MPAKLDEIQEIAKKYNIFLIEDAAEALGAKYKGKKCGSFGDFGIFSFNGNKIITTSSGGALICNTTQEKLHAVYIATQARDNSSYYQHSEIGYNYRMSAICAGIGRGQMEVLNQRIEARRRNFGFYKLELSSFKEITFLKEPKGFHSNRWLTCIVFESNEIREKVRLSLENENIESRPFWKPMHTQPVFKDYRSFVNGVADNLSEKGLCLPSGSNLSEEDITRIVAIIKKYIK
jgi:dTDP-4-amino-4,6-dideoxygalactose transaminase